MEGGVFPKVAVEPSVGITAVPTARWIGLVFADGVTLQGGGVEDLALSSPGIQQNRPGSGDSVQCIAIRAAVFEHSVSDARG